MVALWKVGFQASNPAFGIVAVATLFIGLWVMALTVTARLPPLYVSPVSYCFVVSLTLSGQYWCWIGPGYGGERFSGEFIGLWIAVFASVIMNVSLYFWTQRRLSVELQRMLL